VFADLGFLAWATWWTHGTNRASLLCPRTRRPKRIGQNTEVTGDGSNQVEGGPPPAGVDRRALSNAESATAARRWWDSDADAYWAEHGDFLGTADFVWCPEGLREADVRLLGDVRDRLILEIGCGTAPCARWLAGRGARVTGLDISAGMLDRATSLTPAGSGVGLVQADAARLPFRHASFDVACSAYGAIPFLGDLAPMFREVARVLRPGGLWTFAITHPVRWCFSDDGGPAGLTARNSYWDRRAYVELDAAGQVGYAEHHHTIGDVVRALAATGFRLTDLVEPEWPVEHDRTWGGWSPLRGRVIPGTAIFSGVRESARER
jgi:SAM-dependent methyltransferase